MPLRALLLLLCAALPAAACDPRASEESAAASASVVDTGAARHLAPAEVAWAPIGRWAGTGDKGTERFRVSSGEWRLVGSVRRLDKTKQPWIVVKVFDAARTQVATFSIEDAGSDTSYVQTEPGLYYLTIGTSEARWELTAQERRMPAERVQP